ncbi:hypothetical protein D781_2818 [Serratia sp. FGI94]|nr:hypothetical protein D781_2818 [Serratia sp. FGI94]
MNYVNSLFSLREALSDEYFIDGLLYFRLLFIVDFF